MKPEEFKSLFEAQQIDKLSASIVKDVAFYFGMRGVKNEDIIYFVPMIAHYLQLIEKGKKTDHKANLKDLIDRYSDPRNLDHPKPKI